MWQAIHDHYSGMRYQIPFLVAENDKVAATISLYFRKRSNDRVVQFDIADFYTLREGRIAQICQFLDSFDLVQQVLERDLAVDLALAGPCPALIRPRYPSNEAVAGGRRPGLFSPWR